MTDDRSHPDYQVVCLWCTTTMGFGVDTSGETSTGTDDDDMGRLWMGLRVWVRVRLRIGKWSGDGCMATKREGERTVMGEDRELDV